MRFDKILIIDGSRLCFKNLLIPNNMKNLQNPWKQAEWVAEKCKKADNLPCVSN